MAGPDALDAPHEKPADEQDDDELDEQVHARMVPLSA